MLNVGIDDVGLDAARASLSVLLRDDPASFAALFAPLQPHRAVELPAGVAASLSALHLLESRGGRHTSSHRIRHVGDHLYVMELGIHEFVQDIWPETDALLEQLEHLPPGRLLDLATGSGIVGIEAALRGHAVVATDKYETAITLARFNARLNRAPGIDFRVGHLYEPVAGERFDTILTAPHYTRVADQIRLEALVATRAHIATGGRGIMATFLEFEGPDGPIPVVEAILRPLVAAGDSATVRPIYSPIKPEWFVRKLADPPVAGLLSHHRFLITIEPGGERLIVERPAPARHLAEQVVPLSQLGRRRAAPLGPVRVAITSAPDLEALRRLLAELTAGFVTFTGSIPSGLLDGCRFGANLCVSGRDTGGAAGAQLDVDGGIRPCTSGGVIARVTHSFEALLARQRELADEARSHRGCATCSALAYCSRCLFPALLDDAAYCELVRSAEPGLRALRRLPLVLRNLLERHPRAARVDLKLRRTVRLLAAQGRPYLGPRSAAREPALERVAEAWRARSGWIAAVDGRSYEAHWFNEGGPVSCRLTPFAAALIELIDDGATIAEIDSYTLQEGRPLDQAWTFTAGFLRALVSA